MRLLLATLLLGGVAAVSAAELSPKAVEFLRELGIDPGSAEVTGISDDQIARGADGKPYSLDDFATRRSESGVRNFIVTRNFIRKYLLDTKTPFPPNEVYQTGYLKPEELQFIRAALGGKLQPKAAAFLRELEINPESEQITKILDDQVGMARHGSPYSLDTLATRRDEDGVRQFIATRNFVRKYMKDPKTPFPSVEMYQTRYLKEDEVQFIIKELKKSG